LKQSLLIILTIFFLSFATYSNAQSVLDTNYTLLPTDSIKIENFAKGFMGQVNDINDATKKVQKSLLGKLLNVFKFSSNFKAAEKVRFFDMIGSLGIQDSIKLSENKIKLLILQLSKRENQHYDSLLKLIAGLKTDNVVKSAPTQEEIIAEEESANASVKDKDVDDLTTKILSIVAKKATETEEDKKRNEKLAEIRKVNARRDNVQFVIDSAKNIVHKFVVQSTNKVKVIGFYNYGQNINNDELNLSNYNNIIYNGVFVDKLSGHIKNLNGWDTAQLLNLLDKKNKGLQNHGLERLEKKKIKPILNIIFPNKTDLSNFVLNNAYQQNLINDLSYLLTLHESTEGICLQLNEVDNLYKKQVNEFIIRLSQEIKKVNSKYNIYLIIPPAGQSLSFDFTSITNYVDYFIMDFYSIPKNPNPLPLAPIKGKELNSIESTFSFYVNNKINPEKLILGLSYQGLYWAFINQTQQFKFIQPLTYAEIRGRYNWPITYNDEFGTAMMDSLDKKGVLKRRIFLEDEKTLSKKYDFVLQNGLGGVSIYTTSFDKGYGELNDMLVYKLADIETIPIEDSVIKIPKEPNIFEIINMRMYLYQYILNHPCMVCFDNISDYAVRAKIFNYITRLGWDKAAENANMSRFLLVTEHLNKFAFQVLIFFSLILVTLITFYIVFFINGKNVKLISTLCIIFLVLFLLSGVLTLFTSNKFAIFGVYNNKKSIEKVSRDNGPVPIGSHDPSVPDSDTTYTEVANGGANNNTQTTPATTGTNTTGSHNNNNNSGVQAETNAERMAANDANKGIKNRYLNSTARIFQNAYFRNKTKNKKQAEASNVQNGQTTQNKPAVQRDGEIMYSTPMNKTEFADYKNDNYCLEELEKNSSGCINIPFNTLFLVIFFALIIGAVIDIFFIRKLAVKNEIP
jgi:hypothetical protein